MTDGQYFACLVGVAAGIVLTAWLLWCQISARWQWRSLTRRARPDPWPYDWRATCPELRQPIHFHIRRR